MTDKTFHVVRLKEGWAVKKAGKKAATFSSQDKAVKAARESAKREREAQVVVHARNGRFVVKEVRGLPVVQKPAQRSSIGTTRIAKAISDTLQKRLEKA